MDGCPDKNSFIFHVHCVLHTNVLSSVYSVDLKVKSKNINLFLLLLCNITWFANILQYYINIMNVNYLKIKL